MFFVVLTNTKNDVYKSSNFIFQMDDAFNVTTLNNFLFVNKEDTSKCHL